MLSPNSGITPVRVFLLASTIKLAWVHAIWTLVLMVGVVVVLYVIMMLVRKFDFVGELLAMVELLALLQKLTVDLSIRICG